MGQGRISKRRFPYKCCAKTNRCRQSDFYKNSSSVIDGKITYHMFSETDNVEHARLKRPVVRHYSVPSVLAMEPHMDKVISDFLGHLRKCYVEPKKVCEFGEWLGYCTFRTFRLPMMHC
jgi:hypothetical protein